MILRCPHCNAQAAKGRATCPACRQQMTRPCPLCGEEISVKATLCKYCGEMSGHEAPPSPAPEIVFLDEEPASCAWEQKDKGLLRRWWGTWWESNFCPARFFEKLPRKSGHGWPVGYAYGLMSQMLALATIAAVVVGVVTAVSGTELPQNWLWYGVAGLAGGIVISFLAVWIGLYGASLLWHPLLILLGAKGGFQGTLRVLGYSSGAAAWKVIPVLGPIIAFLQHLRLCYHGFRQVHGLSPVRAMFALILPMLAVMTLVLAACVILAHTSPCEPACC